MKACRLGLIFAVICYSSRGVEAGEEPQQKKAKTSYLVIYRPGPGWLVGKSVLEQPLKEHGKYMLSLYIKGSMKLAGPLTDDAGGAVLLVVSANQKRRRL